jgi:hypothetical protein
MRAVVRLDARRDLGQQQSVRMHLDHGEVGDDEIDDPLRRERILALGADARAAASRRMRHRHDQALRAASEVHRPADGAAAALGQVPVSEIAILRHLESAQDRHMDVPTADHRERSGAVEEAGAR